MLLYVAKITRNINWNHNNTCGVFFSPTIMTINDQKKKFNINVCLAELIIILTAVEVNLIASNFYLHI